MISSSSFISLFIGKRAWDIEAIKSAMGGMIEGMTESWSLQGFSRSQTKVILEEWSNLIKIS